MTSKKNEFTNDDNALLALMLFRRFDFKVDATVEAWRRMTQEIVTVDDMVELVDRGIKIVEKEAKRSLRALRSASEGDEKIAAFKKAVADFQRLVEPN